MHPWESQRQSNEVVCLLAMTQALLWSTSSLQTCGCCAPCWSACSRREGEDFLFFSEGLGVGKGHQGHADSQKRVRPVLLLVFGHPPGKPARSKPNQTYATRTIKHELQTSAGSYGITGNMPSTRWSLAAAWQEQLARWWQRSILDKQESLATLASPRL